MLTADNFRIERVVQPGAGAHRPIRTLNQNPVTTPDSARGGNTWMQLHFRVQSLPTQASQSSQSGVRTGPCCAKGYLDLQR